MLGGESLPSRAPVGAWHNTHTSTGPSGGYQQSEFQGSNTGFINFQIGGETVDASRWPTITAYIDRVFTRPAIKPIVEGDLGS